MSPEKHTERLFQVQDAEADRCRSDGTAAQPEPESGPVL